MTDRLPRRAVLGYAVGSVGAAAFATVPGLLLLYQLTDVLAVPAGVASAVLFGAKAWDVVANPVIGALSDRSAAVHGGRTRFLVAGGCTLPPLFALMFATPDVSPGVAAVYVGVTFTLAATAYAVFQVPYVGLPAELTESPAERTRLTAYRMVMLTLGILIAGAGAPAIVAAAGKNRGGYALMGVVMAVVIAASLLIAAFTTRRLPLHPHGAPGMGVRAQLRLALGNKPFVLLLAAFLAQSLGVGVMLAGEPYIAEYRLGDSGLTTVLFLCTIGPAILVMPAWAKFGARYGKRAGLITSVTLFGVAAISMVATLHPSTKWLACGQLALVGIGYAGQQLFALAMLPDTIAADEARSGTRQSGAFSGVWTGAETLALAAGPALFGAVLALSSFVSSSGDPVPQPASALSGILLGFTVLPGVLALVSLPVVARYRLPVTSPVRPGQPASPR
ncbi:MFS transporter [Labedaea rhizosphaerae]|uniref:Na+/melibiose symporter-like transporter n=1 Tax=Labedaea rhizosphaerae TaxID=598644 RepID=A0A4V3CZ09_LABRH|nr:MFS transporter [Labedaea rhizosphaerae]TDP96198.1 Na+/melibiose symporter-like transporter [Labedaea rhizosphaerae]